MKSRSIIIPDDYFLRDWGNSSNNQIMFSISEVGSHAILRGGIVREINNDADIAFFKKMFQYFIKQGYAKIYSSNSFITIYELTDKGKERSTHVDNQTLTF